VEAELIRKNQDDDEDEIGDEDREIRDHVAVPPQRRDGG
jgi:hypothetical protein